MTADAEISLKRQVEQYAFSRNKLPKALSYPLKRSLLDAALRSACVYEMVWFVRYLGRQNGTTVLDAHFSPEQYSYAASGKVLINVWAVPANERKACEELLLKEGLALLCRWLVKAQAEANAWRGFGHSVAFQRIGEELRYIEQ